MKTFLALWIAGVLLTASGYQYQQRYAIGSIAEERLHAGPLSLELHVRFSDVQADEQLVRHLPAAGIKTEFTASLAPLSIRAVIAVNVGSATEASATETPVD